MSDFSVNDKVVISKDVPWTSSDAAVAAKPKMGLVGVIANPDEYPYPTPPSGKTAVIFQAKDLGYIPHDEDSETVCYYISTNCLSKK